MDSLKDRYPLNPTQEGMLFHHLSGVRSGVDIEQIVCVLPEEVQLRELTSAWQQAVDRYETLRTRFDWSSSPMMQQVEDPWQLSVEAVDWRRLAKEEQEDKLEEFLQGDRMQGFHLDELPLMRLRLFRLSEADYRLVWTFHHAILDGRSFTILLREVFGLYDGYCGGEEGELPQVPRFANYSSWLAESQDEGAARDFWRRTLEGFAVPNSLVVDKARPEQEGTPNGVVECVLAPDMLAKLNNLAAKNEVTLNTAVQGAWALVLSRYSGEHDIVFGATRACRHVPVESPEEMLGVFINTLPVRIQIKPEMSVGDYLKRLREQFVAIRPFEHTSLAKVQAWSEVPQQTALFDSLIVFERYDLTELLQAQGERWSQREFHLREQTNYPVTLYAYAGTELRLKISYDHSLFDEGTAGRMLNHVRVVLQRMAAGASKEAVADLNTLSDEEEEQLLVNWNDTGVDYPSSACIQHLIEAQADPRQGGNGALTVSKKGPDAVAVVCKNQELTYGELNARANQLARHLQKLGVGPDTLVGISTDRSVDMVVGLLGILKAGGAYVPLDPTYPAERIAFMLNDSKAPVLVTQQSLLSDMPEHDAEVVCLDKDWPVISREATDNFDSGVRSENLAYVIYTSGSTGKPKGVMVEHRNVVNFFAGMDQAIEYGSDPVWLAVTSLSFDISVLEIFWTLSRGFKVVVFTREEFDPFIVSDGVPDSAAREIDFSLFYFSADQGRDPDNKYRLLIEGARFADKHGFAAVWTPERHFHDFGGLYPNPSVTGAALAVLTENVQIRSGSVVAPLHSPIRIAEEWSVVDNLSHGRAGISFASGWMPEDFVIKPENYDDRKELMFECIDTVRKLWRGEAIAFPNPVAGGDDVMVTTLPTPVQAEVPVWVTTAGNPETYQMAAKVGASILTHLLGQSIEEVAEKIAIYRKAWTQAGHPGRGHVTLMLHTFVGDQEESIKEIVREPLTQYLRTSAGLIKKYSWAFPTFKRLGKSVEEVNFGDLNEEEMDAVLAHAFDRYYETSGLFGTPTSCAETIGSLKSNDVDEIACLIDFGVSTDIVLANLQHLGRLRTLTSLSVVDNADKDQSIPALIERHGVTHFQCTPSMASMLLADGSAERALGKLEKWMIGGEAFPPTLASKIKEFMRGDVINMYGPTETTIWSSTYKIDGEGGSVSIGRPIANTELYIVDKALRPVPIGVPGELMIAGDGVVRGYLNRPELTAEQFLPDPFDDDPEARLYRTGDLVRYLPDGNIEFIGRMDHQVKLRGHRIELGEIEDRLRNHPAVRDAVAIVREDNPSDMRIVAYWIAMNGESSQASELREHLRIKLPEYMLPAHFVRMDAFPQTPNKKIDRKAFPLPGRDPDDGLREFERPATAVEETLAELWRQTFGVDQVGRHDNFFDLGGHSLSSVQIVGSIGRAFNIKFPLRTFFEDPVLSSLALRVEDLLSKGADRTPRDAPSVAQKPRGTQGTARPHRSQQVAEKERIAVAIPESKELSLPPVSRRDSPERTIDEQVVQASPQTAWTPRREPFWRGLKNRILQVLALYSPGSRTLRVWLHRWRGVRLADNVEIGTGVIIETTYPQLVSISDNCEIGIRTVFIGHFREMADEARKEGRPTIEVEEEVFIGPGVTILPNVTIGRGAVVTAGSVVNELVAPHTVVQGNPAKPIAGCSVPLVNHTYAEFVANLVPIELEDRPHQLDNL